MVRENDQTQEEMGIRLEKHAGKCRKFLKNLDNLCQKSYNGMCD